MRSEKSQFSLSSTLSTRFSPSNFITTPHVTPLGTKYVSSSAERLEAGNCAVSSAHSYVQATGRAKCDFSVSPNSASRFLSAAAILPLLSGGTLSSKRQLPPTVPYHILNKFLSDRTSPSCEA